MRTCSVTNSCLTLCDSIDSNPPGCSVHGIFQARIQDWVAISSSRGSSQPRDWNLHLLCLLHWQVDSSALRRLGSPCFVYTAISAQSSVHCRIFLQIFSARLPETLSHLCIPVNTCQTKRKKKRQTYLTN